MLYNMRYHVIVNLININEVRAVLYFINLFDNICSVVHFYCSFLLLFLFPVAPFVFSEATDE